MKHPAWHTVWTMSSLLLIGFVRRPAALQEHALADRGCSARACIPSQRLRAWLCAGLPTWHHSVQCSAVQMGGPALCTVHGCSTSFPPQFATDHTIPKPVRHAPRAPSVPVTATSWRAHACTHAPEGPAITDIFPFRACMTSSTPFPVLQLTTRGSYPHSRTCGGAWGARSSTSSMSTEVSGRWVSWDAAWLAVMTTRGI